MDNMKPRICICCGEPMSASGNELSRNPNVCASCSSLVDGMDDNLNPDQVATTDLQSKRLLNAVDVPDAEHH
jgi:hypothetical protein